MNKRFDRSKQNAIFWCFAVLIALARPAGAQSTDKPVFRAEISSTSVYLGDTVAYQLVLFGAAPLGEPDAGFPEGLSAMYRGANQSSGSSMRIINGRAVTSSRSSYMYNYELTVSREGELTIPAVTIETDSGTLTSNPVRIRGVLPEPSSGDILEVSAPDRAVYVGEPVAVDVVWWVDARTSDYSFDSSVLPSNATIEPVPIGGLAADEYEFSLKGRPAVGYLGESSLDGRDRAAFRFRLIVTPTEPGPLTIGPMRITFTRLEGFGSRARKMYAESDPVTLDVLELPSSGMPQGYTGLIGRFSLSTDASNPSVNVGDPIELRLRVGSPGRVPELGDTLGTRVLEDAGFRVAPEGWRRERANDPGIAEFSTMIRATTDDIDSIPPIAISSFDPETASYETFESEPIPIEVRAVRRVTIEDAVIAPGADPVNPLPSRTLSRSDATLWAHPGADALRSARREPRIDAWITHPVWIGYAGGCVAMPLLALVFAGFRRAHDPERARIRIAYTSAKSSLGRSHEAQAARTMLGAVLGMDPDAVTSADVRRAPIPRDAANVLTQVLNRHESGHSDPVDAPYALTRTHLAQVRDSALGSRSDA